MTLGLVDFHCHLDLYPDHGGVIDECERLGIHTLTVTTTPKAWPCNRDLAREARYVQAALGLHPQLVAERMDELSLLEAYLPETRYVGEVGLDGGPRFYQSFDQQKQVFERVLTLCAQHGGKILTVHSVRAVTTVLDMLETHLPATRARIVLHWFTGSRSEARRAANLGCYFSVNGEMLRSLRHRDMVAALPLDRLLTETDGPFVRSHGRIVRPSNVAATLSDLASLRGISVREMSMAIRTNLHALVAT